jgi:hypothetical protein
MFPNAVFSGRGGSNDYHQARFYGDGWCSLGYGTEYLLINLQNDYHITRVVTMGNKQQTKWSNSYSLRYSRTETFVGGTAAVNVSTATYLRSYHGCLHDRTSSCHWIISVL